MNTRIRIGLFGMYGLYNFGCEAIVRGTYELLKQAWPSCEVILYTYCPKEDQKIVSDLDIMVKPVLMKKNKILRRILNKSLRVFSIQRQLSLWDAKAVANECDMIFSVGGDIYTIPNYILKNKTETKNNEIVEFGNNVLRCKPMVIWGASIGPFGENPHVKEYYFRHLREIKQIFCREEKTYNYLKSNGVTSNIQLCSDPAFYIKATNGNSNIYVKSEKIRIALNLSPLSIREQIGENHESFNKQIIDSIVDLLSIPNSEVVLIPHVLSSLSDGDNDLIYLREIYNRIPKKYLGSIDILEDAVGFLGTKEFLRTCDIVIAARMHCAVNAVSEGIPAIFLTYSQKGIGMTEYIYGNSKWSVPLLDIKKELKNKTTEMLSNKKKISDNIKKRILEIKRDESKIVELFKKFV